MEGYIYGGNPDNIVIDPYAFGPTQPDYVPPPTYQSAPTPPASNSSFSDWLKVGLAAATTYYASKNQSQTQQSRGYSEAKPYGFSLFNQASGNPPPIAGQSSSNLNVPLIAGIGIIAIIFLFMLARR